MQCKRCEQEKTKDKFHSDKRNKSGVHLYCKACRKADALIEHYEKAFHQYNIKEGNTTETDWKKGDYSYENNNFVNFIADRITEAGIKTLEGKEDE